MTEDTKSTIGVAMFVLFGALFGYMLGYSSGYSGGIDKRPGLQSLLEDARNKRFEIVYVYRMDRFFRKLRGRRGPRAIENPLLRV
ncbi:hypothetical protein LCGC14_3046190 [marine sediment metagenome]|uniref:Resolvase/invertase-type recombinase catalytic domain-containing protein n=1 Tax=marine sediment metagenome TaxID=412755 RepID=A0A0F8YW23_9ZZZZ